MKFQLTLSFYFIFFFIIACKDEKTTILEIKDVDGNIYHSVKIGSQVWMIENLKSTKFRNGDPIPYITDNVEWGNLKSEAYCNLLNDSSGSTANNFGRLYNFFVISDTRGIAPIGWHVPTVYEWTTLIEYLGGAGLAGGKMKEKWYFTWSSPNEGATNESGFTARPGGMRYGTLGFSGIFDAYFWSSTVDSNFKAYSLNLYHTSAIADTTIDSFQNGLSIRCIKD